MEDGKKKTFMIGAIIGCLVLASIITYTSQFKKSGIKSIGSDEVIWVKCDNPDCGQACQIKKRAYFEFLQKEAKPMAPAPPMVCEKCEQESAYRAVKCEQCGEVFFHGKVGSDFTDRCPKCGFSEIEDLGKQ